MSGSEYPKISIVTASYQALAGLKETVASIQAQSFRDFEHIVADGGSTDGTQAYLESLGQQVRWISEPDEGIGDALNKGIALAQGQYVFVLHAEDTFHSETSLAMAAAALDGVTDLISFDVDFVTAHGSNRFRSRGLPFKINFKTTIPHQGAFCLRSLFERIGSFDTSYKVALDYEFFLRAYRQGASVRTVPEMVSRMPDTGLSSRLDWASLQKRFAEERRIHWRHCPGPFMGAVYTVYWPLYLAYRRLRHQFWSSGA